jgi:hypothetical protein
MLFIDDGDERAIGSDFFTVEGGLFGDVHCEVFQSLSSLL